MNVSPLLRLTAGSALLLLGACTAPRSIISSGKVTPKGQFKVGGNVGFNVGSASLSNTTGAIRSLAEQALSKDTVNYRPAFNQLQAAALAYVLDPTVATSDLYLRYGVVDRLDVGYKYSFGAHSFDAMYQFLGPVGTPERPGGPAGATYGSVGLQFSTQRAKLPSIPFLDNASNLLGFTARRVDLLIPLVFSRSLGPEEEIGNISYGVAYSHSFLKYGFNPGKVYNSVPGGASSLVPPLTARQNFGAVGAFVNAKLGYRYVYFLPALAVYYQSFGNYALLNGASVKLRGVTFIPSLGLQFRIPAGRQ